MPDGEGYRPVDEEPLLGQAKDFPPDYEPEPDSGETVDAAEPADSLEAEGAMEEPDAKAAISPFPVQKIDFQGDERAAGVDEAGEEEADGDASAEAIIEAAMAEVQAEDGGTERKSVPVSTAETMGEVKSCLLYTSPSPRD